MQWLNKIADEVVAAHPEGEILVESGGSPSGTHHLGHLRELITSDAIMLELRSRGRDARHVYFVDDLDGLRKIPVNVPAEYEQYLGRPLCDIPSPAGTSASYADYFLAGLKKSAKALGIEIEFIRSHKKYRTGFFVPAIERSLDKLAKARKALEKISGRQLDENWSPIQIMEGGYLKKRRFISIDPSNKTLEYEDKDGTVRSTGYARGEVKLDWRLDWPGRWWLMEVSVEPFGRDHASAGGSYDTGVQIMKDVYEAPPPLPVPYDFVNLAGDTKKMSASKGTGLDAESVIKVLPPEIIRYFMLRFPPAKRLYFDPVNGTSQLMDEFAGLLAAPDKSEDDKRLIELSVNSVEPTVSAVPFSHLVASYQAALKNSETTLEIICRTEHKQTVADQEDIIRNELKFIDNWLKLWAPDEVKFELSTKPPKLISEPEREYLLALAKKVEQAPADTDGEWFHKAVYDFKDTTGLTPKQLFSTIYKVTIGQESGPRAGWFLSILPRDWLIKRLRLEA
jgi:lysyl-tRNA synthetase, class I